MIKIDNDALTMVDEQQVADAAIHLLNAMQDHKPATQIYAIQALYRLLLDIYQLNPRQLLEQTDRIMKEGTDDYWSYRFQSVKAYIEGELSK